MTSRVTFPAIPSQEFCHHPNHLCRTTKPFPATTIKFPLPWNVERSRPCGRQRPGQHHSCAKAGSQTTPVAVARTTATSGKSPSARCQPGRIRTWLSSERFVAEGRCPGLEGCARRRPATETLRRDQAEASAGAGRTGPAECYFSRMPTLCNPRCGAVWSRFCRTTREELHQFSGTGFVRLPVGFFVSILCSPCLARIDGESGWKRSPGSGSRS